MLGKKKAQAATFTVAKVILRIPVVQAIAEIQSEPSLVRVELDKEVEGGRRRLREEEDGRCPWRPSDNLLKKAEHWLIVPKNFEFHLVLLCAQERSVL